MHARLVKAVPAAALGVLAVVLKFIPSALLLGGGRCEPFAPHPAPMMMVAQADPIP